MQFQSFEFLFLFLPITWLLFMAVRFTRLRPVLFTISGYVFYAWGQPWIAILLFLSSTVDFCLGALLNDAKSEHKRKFLLVCSLVFNLGLLAVFKYSGWLFTNINTLITSLGIAYRLPILDLPLPPGISFYTFQSLSYIIDIYRRKIHAHRRIWDYWGFVAFFPQLFAGPIERAGHLLPQMLHPKRIHPRMIESGLFLISWGLFKKLCIADNMAGIIELAKTNNALSLSGLAIALAFTFQIYADFSAYTDIARGSARLFGIRLRRNFLTPYLSRNPSEFWQRWHMSLSQWLRDYLYISLGGNRGGTAATLRNLLITMFLAGLWHGAGWFFIIWGIYHGLLLVLYRLVPIDAWLERHFKHVGSWLARALMFAFIVFGWTFFYTGESGRYAATFLHHGDAITTVSNLTLLAGILLFALPIIVTDALGFRRGREFVDLWQHYSPALKTVIYILLFYAIVIFGARSSYEFIYFRF